LKAKQTNKQTNKQTSKKRKERKTKQKERNYVTSSAELLGNGSAPVEKLLIDYHFELITYFSRCCRVVLLE